MLSGLWGMGSDGIWWAMSLSNTGAAILALLFFFSGNWKGIVIQRRRGMALEPLGDPAEES